MVAASVFHYEDIMSTYNYKSLFILLDMHYACFCEISWKKKEEGVLVLQIRREV